MHGLSVFGRDISGDSITNDGDDSASDTFSTDLVDLITRLMVKIHAMWHPSYKQKLKTCIVEVV